MYSHALYKHIIAHVTCINTDLPDVQGKQYNSKCKATFKCMDTTCTHDVYVSDSFEKPIAITTMKILIISTVRQGWLGKNYTRTCTRNWIYLGGYVCIFFVGEHAQVSEIWSLVTEYMGYNLLYDCLKCLDFCCTSTLLMKYLISWFMNVMNNWWFYWLVLNYVLDKFSSPHWKYFNYNRCVYKLLLIETWHPDLPWSKGY